MMSNQTPLEYAWIKPGAKGFNAPNNLTVTFTSEPYISEFFWNEARWAAEDDEGFEVILNNDWQPATHS